MSALDTSALTTVRSTTAVRSTSQRSLVTPRSRAAVLSRLLKPAASGQTVARRERYLQQVEAFRTTHSDHSTLRTGGSAWPEFN